MDQKLDFKHGYYKQNPGIRNIVVSKNTENAVGQVDQKRRCSKKRKSWTLFITMKKCKLKHVGHINTGPWNQTRWQIANGNIKWARTSIGSEISDNEHKNSRKFTRVWDLKNKKVYFLQMAVHFSLPWIYICFVTLSH